MPFRIALSGLNAAQADLNVTANNIANTSTTGFKGSRTEFADMFAVSLQGVSSNASGNAAGAAQSESRTADRAAGQTTPRRLRRRPNASRASSSRRIKVLLLQPNCPAASS